MSIPVWFQQWHLGQNTGKPAQTAYVNRVTADGGIVEAIGCVPQAVWDWTAPAAPTLLLDLFPNAAAAYSLRKLRAAYSGAAVRVRESGGNTEADIGFTSAGELDTTALLAHCGANDGFVTVWYDQSLSNNATQTTAANQPKIVNAGSLVTENGKAAIDFDGGNDFLLNNTFTIDTSGGFSIFFLEKENSLPANNGTFNVGTIATNGLSAFYNSIATYTPITIGVRTSSNRYKPNGSIARNTNQQLLSFIFDGVDESLQSSFNFSINNSLISAVNAGTIAAITSNEFRIGRAGAVFTGEYFIGKKQEFIIYPSNQSANRTAIETNINNFYSIYP